MTRIGVIIVSVLIAILRIVGVKHEFFQAIAHIWIGGLLWEWLGHKSDFAKWLTITLTIIEVLCFLVFNFLLYR